MESNYGNESGFSEHEIYGARKAFFRDCPNGRCSKRKFLNFIRKSCLQKSNQSNIHPIRTLKNYRYAKKFFTMMFDIYDRNHDGELDFDEYIYALSAITGANRLRTIETLFSFFDVDNQGYITRKDFNSRKKLAAKFLGQYRPGITDTLYDKTFSAMDVDKDGYISKEEFIEWHLKDHSTNLDEKPVKKRTRLLPNSINPFNIKGEIKTSSLQQKDKYSVDFWLETALDVNCKPEFPISPTTDRHLLKIFDRARSHFHHTNLHVNDNQSDSGLGTTSSSATILTESDFDVISSFETDDFNNSELNFNDDKDQELFCLSFENILMETILELRQKRKTMIPNMNILTEENETIQITRL